MYDDSGDDIPGRKIAAYLEKIAGLVVADPVRVELLPWAADARLAGMVAWGGKSWVVLMSDAYKGRRLFWLLCHELGHVKAGHVARKPYDIALARAVFTGKKVPPLLKAAVEGPPLPRSAPQVEKALEIQADAFADLATASWWPIMREWRDPVEAARVARLTDRDIRAMGGDPWKL